MNWRAAAVRELRAAAPAAVATLARQAKLGDPASARAVLELLDRLDHPRPTGARSSD